MPYPVFRTGLKRVNGVEGRPGIFYFHPWEVDPGQPHVPQAGRGARFRHRVGLETMVHRLERLLRDFRWDRMDAVFAETIGSASPVPLPAQRQAA
jgi:hypothetical protein